ncbi:MAG: 1-acyl-sn-glycerol-3-phosphate acyltransferase [Vicinamibacterales bacterium]|nr:1-acyl-sn-glycerol-3-phosphate acyltransferase [Vicinamibacterales bacterium]
MDVDITQAVLSREEVARYLRGGPGVTPDQAHERISTYLEELRTTQRYSVYRALKHPLYPILRKIRRHPEFVELAQAATRSHRVVYASNHKSHIDYLVELLVLDDHGIHPPVIAAGINLFNGAMGLLNRHVTGAIPIRRNSRDPAYLATLRAYVAELVQRHDLFLYLEGGRSYSGEFKSLKTGLLQAVVQARRPDAVIVPVAIAYDLVLEDQALARQGMKRRQRRFTGEVAEMVRYAVGYESRAFVTFGQPIPLENVDPDSRRDLVTLTRHTREAIGKIYKVLPTALLAAALKPSMPRQSLVDRIDQLLDALRSVNANLGVESGHQAVEQATDPLVARGVIVVEGDRYRVRERHVLRYYARSLTHLLKARAGSSNTQ